MIFHLVSRMHRAERWLVPPLRDEVSSLIRRMVERTDARLLAYAVMPNHLHVLLRQGESELETVMQPLLRRVAYRVQRYHGFQGRVVERPFRHRACACAAHAREALMYVHLNPWRAGLCDDDLAYPWTTAGAYLPGADPALFGIRPQAQLPMLELFASADRCSRQQLCRDYAIWLERRRNQRLPLDRPGHQTTLDPPLTAPDPAPGDRAWSRHFAPAVQYDTRIPTRNLPDLRDYVMGLLLHLAMGTTPDDLYGSWLPRPAARLRAQVIRAAAENGYRTGALARFFGVSPATVSTAKYDRSA